MKYLFLFLLLLGGSQLAAAQSPQATSLRVRGHIRNYDGRSCVVKAEMVGRVDTLRVQPDGSFDQTLTNWPGLQKVFILNRSFTMVGWWAPGFDLTYQLVAAPSGASGATGEEERYYQTQLTGYGSVLGNYELAESRALPATSQKTTRNAQAHAARLRAIKDSLWQASFSAKTQRQLKSTLPIFDEFARIKANERFFTYFQNWRSARTVDTTVYNREFRTPAVYQRMQQPENLKCQTCMIMAEGYVQEQLSRRLKQAQPRGVNAYYALQLPEFGKFFSPPLAGYMRMDILREIAGNSEIEDSPSASEIKGLIEQYFPAGEEKAKSQLLSRLAKTQEYKATSRARLVLQAPAPDFQVQDSTGQMYSLASFKGKVVFIDFWASWCGPCRFEMPFTKRLYETYRTNPNVIFLSVAIRDKQANWQRSVREDKPAGLALWDHAGQASKAFHTSYIPRYALIGKRGELLDGYVSGPYLAEQKTRKAIDKALQE